MGESSAPLLFSSKQMDMYMLTERLTIQNARIRNGDVKRYTMKSLDPSELVRQQRVPLPQIKVQILGLHKGNGEAGRSGSFGAGPGDEQKAAKMDIWSRSKKKGRKKKAKA